MGWKIHKSIIVLNTKTGSAGSGYEAWCAWNNRHQRKSGIIHSVQDAVKDIYIGLGVEDPRYLAKRLDLPAQVGAMAGMAATMANLRLLVTVEDGILKPNIPPYRGDKKLREKIVDDLEAHSLRLHSPLDVWVLHTGDENGIGQKLRDVLKGEEHVQSVHYTTLTPAIGTYLGINRCGVIAHRTLDLQ